MTKKAGKVSIIPHIYKEIEGFFNFENLYREIADWIPDGGVWVEVGVYWGRSFSFGVVETVNRGKSIDMVAVDAWPDAWTSPEGWPMVEKFKHEMAPLEGYFRFIQSGSADAARHFADGSVDFVFIDADHVYPRVIEDIRAWLPKIKPGGIMAGHDYNYPHTGVVHAVNEMFPGRFIPVPCDDYEVAERPFYSWKVQL